MPALTDLRRGRSELADLITTYEQLRSSRLAQSRPSNFCTQTFSRELLKELPPSQCFSLARDVQLAAITSAELACSSIIAASDCAAQHLKKASSTRRVPTPQRTSSCTLNGVKSDKVRICSRTATAVVRFGPTVAVFADQQLEDELERNARLGKKLGTKYPEVSFLGERIKRIQKIGLSVNTQRMKL